MPPKRKICTVQPDTPHSYENPEGLNTVLPIYRGVLLGGLLGDCYGYVFERKKRIITIKEVVDLITSSCTPNLPTLIYTDDTQMGLGTLQSLRTKGQFDPCHMAETFAKNFFDSGSKRYYGGQTKATFRTWDKIKYVDIFSHAAAKFKGQGSFGNGGAMRVSPAALYARNMPEREFTDFIINLTRMTHTHPLALLGSLLQAFAVREVITLSTSWIAEEDKSGPVDLACDKFVDDMMEKLRSVENSTFDVSSDIWKSSLARYEERLSLVKELLTQIDIPTTEEVVNKLGHNVEAINSVPTALYIFLRSLNPIPYFDYTSVLVRCMAYAFHIGRDTDSIGGMACSLAGGLIGLPAFTHPGEPDPEVLLNRCEELKVLDDYAKWLAHRAFDNEQDNTSESPLSKCAKLL